MLNLKSTYRNLTDYQEDWSGDVLMFQTIFLTIALLPFRLAAITTLMILAWLLACLGLHGLSEEDLRRAPLKGWRRYVWRKSSSGIIAARKNDPLPYSFISNSESYLYHAIHVNTSYISRDCFLISMLVRYLALLAN